MGADDHPIQQTKNCQKTIYISAITIKSFISPVKKEISILPVLFKILINEFDNGLLTS